MMGTLCLLPEKPAETSAGGGMSEIITNGTNAAVPLSG